MKASNITTDSGFSVESELALLKNAVDIDRASKSNTCIHAVSATDLTVGDNISLGYRKWFDFSDEAFNWTIDTICQASAKIEDGSLILQPQKAYLLITSFIVHANCDVRFKVYWSDSSDNENFLTKETRRMLYNHPRDNTGALKSAAEGDVQLTSIVFYTDSLQNLAKKYWRPSVIVELPDSAFSPSADVVIKKEEFTVIGFPKWSL